MGSVECCWSEAHWLSDLCPVGAAGVSGEWPIRVIPTTICIRARLLPLHIGIFGSGDFLNELSRLKEPGHLAGMAAGRTDVIPLLPKDCEEEVVAVPPGYTSFMATCYSHGLAHFRKHAGHLLDSLRLPDLEGLKVSVSRSR